MGSKTRAGDQLDDRRTSGRRASDAGFDRGRTADSPTDIPAKGWKDIAKRVWGEMQENHTQLMSSGVAFWLFTSIFPGLIAAITIYGLIVDPQQVAQRVEDLAGALPAEAKTLLEDQLNSIASSSGAALGFGLLFSVGGALWAASAGMSNLMEAINSVYDEHDDRNFFKKKGVALLLTLGAVAFFGLALGGIAGIPAVLESAGIGGVVGTLLNLAVWPVMGALFVGALAILYRFAPDRDDAEWRWVSPGAVAAMVLWVVASLAFQFYTANFGSYQETYGALAAVVILLLWLMISSLTILIGAHVNAEMEAQTARDTTVGAEQPMGQRGAEKADHLGPAEAADRDDSNDSDDDDQQHRNEQTIDLREEHVR